jgi:FtsP/CotA-like multicopper oxidase with cupredoxin domain
MRDLTAKQRRQALLGAMIALLAGSLVSGCDSGGSEQTHDHGTASSGQGKQRTFYIAADEVAWNYAPSGRNLITGKAFGPVEATFVAPGPERIGHMYLKAVYREYTDATFRQLKPRGERWRHLGLLGPVIHAEVGDTIKVVFKNNLRIPASVHAHGVFYAKGSEGAPYADGTAAGAKADDAVPSGRRVTYTWKVPLRAGPGPMDGSSVLWMYHSHVDEVKDTNTGLVGPIIVTRPGKARADGSPTDVDRELVAYFSVVDENESWLLDRNIRRYLGAGETAQALEADEDFHESNLMHSINGYVYGHTPGMVIRKGERVRWYVMDLGTEVDLHTPHWHGNVVTVNGMRSDMLDLLPGMMTVADMRPDDAGTWLFHCHVNDHITAGMQALYRVR